MRSDERTDVTWDNEVPPDDPGLGALGWLRILCRGTPLGVTVFGGLLLLLLLRCIEHPMFGPRRPLTPWITRGVCTAAFWWMGLERRVEGAPMTRAGAAVANHASWIDIFALNASDCIYFVAKHEVASWPGIGWLARATGTVFIRRDRRDARAQTLLFQERLNHGHRLLFFPEGTSTDGLRVLPFKTTLFAPFFEDHLINDVYVQPITVRYTAPLDRDPRFYGWWGDMGFGPHLLKVLAAPRQGRVDVIYHPPMSVAASSGRKTLASQCEHQIREALHAT